MSIDEKETAGQMLQRLGMDGKLWAEEMHKHFPTIAEDDLLGWCCNMIMAGYDEAERRANKKTQQPIQQPQEDKEYEDFYHGYYAAQNTPFEGSVAAFERLYFRKPYHGVPVRESSGWQTLSAEPIIDDAYGIGLSAPLIFRTKEMTSGHIHIRLGYYNKNEAAFYEAGEKKPWKVYEVTHWFMLPPSPPINQIEDQEG